MQRAFARRPLRVVARPVVNLTTGRVVSREYMLQTTESANVTADELFARALNEGNLVGIDLDYFRVRLHEAETADARPCHISLFPDTVLDERIEELIPALLRYCADGEVRVGLSAGLLPLDLARLEGRIAQLRLAGAKIEMLDVGGSRGALDSVVALQPEFARLSADLVQDVGQLARKRQVLRIARLLRALGCTVAADGVDNDGQRRALLDIGIEFGSGRVADIGYEWGSES